MNDKGLTLLGVLASMCIGIICIGALGKAIIGFSEKSSSLKNKLSVSEVKHNIINMLRSEKAWLASVEKASYQHEIGDCTEAVCGNEKCFPGAKIKDADGNETEAYCPIKLWYNRSNPNSQEKYNTSYNELTDDGKPGTLYPWVFPYNNSGMAFFSPTGTFFKRKTDADLGAPGRCEIGRLKNNPELCFRFQYRRIKKYIKVVIHPPEVGASDPNTIPEFKLSIIDMGMNKRIDTFIIENTQNVLNDTRDACPSDLVIVGDPSKKGSFCISPEEEQVDTDKFNFWDAMEYCRKKGAEICYHTQWFRACRLQELAELNGKPTIIKGFTDGDMEVTRQASYVYSTVGVGSTSIVYSGAGAERTPTGNVKNTGDQITSCQMNGYNIDIRSIKEKPFRCCAR